MITTHKIMTGWYGVYIDGKELGIVSKRDDGWHAVLHRYPAPNMPLGIFPTKREAVDEIWIMRDDASTE